LFSTVPVNVGDVTFVMLSEFDEPESDAANRSGAGVGAAELVSIVTDKLPLAAETFPATSVCFAVIV